MNELDRDLFHLLNTTISPVFWICIFYIFIHVHSLQMETKHRLAYSLLFLKQKAHWQRLFKL